MCGGAGGNVDVGGIDGAINDLLGFGGDTLDDASDIVETVVPDPPAETNEPTYSTVNLSPWDPQPTALPVIYGTRRTNGITILRETDSPGGYLYQYYVIAEGTVNFITAYKENNSALPSNDFLKWGYFLGTDGGAQASKPIDGSSGSAITFFNDPPNWGTNQMMKGVAGVAMYFAYSENYMPRVPNIYFIVSGRPVTGNDDNPANILYDYLTIT